MAFHPCDHEDPWTRQVRESYAATIVRAPRVGLGPLTVLSRKDDRVQERGSIAPLLVDAADLALPSVQERAAAALSGGRTSSLRSSLGISLSASLLSGLGLPLPGSSLHGQLWKGAHTFSFEVRNVVERFVDLAQLGSALRGRAIDKDHPTAAVFFAEPDVQMCVITRALVSDELVIRAASKSGQAVDLSADGGELLGSISSQVSWQVESDGGVAFHGPAPATFAVGQVPCNLQPSGAFTFGLEDTGASYFGGADAVDEGELLVMHLPVVEGDGLLDLD